MQFPDLSGLPAWAQVIVYGTFGVSLAIIIGAARFGVMLGKKVPPAATSTAAAVVAVIVDPAELQKLTARRVAKAKPGRPPMPAPSIELNGFSKRSRPQLASIQRVPN